MQLIWHMRKIFGSNFTWHTGWLDDCHWRSIFGWIITETYSWIFSQISKFWSWSDCNTDSCTSWVLVWLLSVHMSVWPLPHNWLPWSYLLGGRYLFHTFPWRSRINSLRYYQLLELLALSFSPTWLIPFSGGRQRAAELASTGFMILTLGLDGVSYRLTAELGLSQHLGYPCGIRLSHHWCAIQLFARLLCYLYLWWTSCLLTGLWAWITPVGSSKLRYLDYYWPLVDCWHSTWVKGEAPWLAGISLASWTYGASFRILSKVPTTSICYMHHFSLASHAFSEFFWGLTHSPLLALA